MGDADIAAHAKANGEAFAANLIRSIRMTAANMENIMIPGSGDREDEDVLPAEPVPATFDLSADLIEKICAPG